MRRRGRRGEKKARPGGRVPIGALQVSEVCRRARQSCVIFPALSAFQMGRRPPGRRVRPRGISAETSSASHFVQPATNRLSHGLHRPTQAVARKSKCTRGATNGMDGSGAPLRLARRTLCADAGSCAPICPGRVRGGTVGKVDPDVEKSLSARSIAAGTGQQPPIWQRDYFDRFMRSAESYSKAWRYVWENPLRAGLVDDPADWPYGGAITELRQSG